MANIAHNPAARRAFSLHDRIWQSNRYVYPVVSRRSKGISVGINLNPDKVCNFDCIYCSVDRTSPHSPNPTAHTPEIDLTLLRTELSTMLSIVRSGDIYKSDPFDKIPAELRRLNDIAFSGDGEPTTCPQFGVAVRIAAEVRDQWQKEREGGTGGNPAPAPVKLVLITNATMFHRNVVLHTLMFIDSHDGEIWAKLDAGTEAYYQLVDRTSIPFQRVLDNILRWCVISPTVIQTLLMRVHGNPPPPEEITAYAGRLQHILSLGGNIKLIQLYTIARRTTETYATPLTAGELEAIAQRLRDLLPDTAIETFS